MIRANVTYRSPPIYPYGDRLGLVIQMPVADTVKRLGTMPSSTTTISIDIPVFGKPLFSFGAGSFAGFGVRSATYDWQQVPTLGTNTIQSSSPYKLVYSGPGSLPIGLDGMANLTWRPRWLPKWRSVQNNVWLGFSGGGFFISVSYTVFAPKGTGTMQNQVINGN